MRNLTSILAASLAFICMGHQSPIGSAAEYRSCPTNSAKICGDLIFSIDYDYARELHLDHHLSEFDEIHDNYMSQRGVLITVTQDDISYLNWYDEEDEEEDSWHLEFPTSYIVQSVHNQKVETSAPVISNVFYFSSLFVNARDEIVAAKRRTNTFTFPIENWPEAINGTFPEITNDVTVTISFTNTIAFIGDYHRIGPAVMKMPLFMNTVYMPSNVVVRLTANINAVTQLKYYPILPPNTNDYRNLRVEDIAFVNEAINDRLNDINDMSASNVVEDMSTVGYVHVPYEFSPAIDTKPASFNRRALTNLFDKVNAFCSPTNFADGVPYLVQFLRPDMVEHLSDDAQSIVYPSIWNEVKEYDSIYSFTADDVIDWVCDLSQLNKTNFLFRSSPSLKDIMGAYERLSDVAYFGSIAGLAIATTNGSEFCDRIETREEHGDYYRDYDYDGHVYGTNYTDRSEATTNKNTMFSFQRLDNSSTYEFRVQSYVKDEKVYGVKITQEQGQSKIEFPTEVKKFREYDIRTSWPEDGVYFYAPYSLSSVTPRGVLMGFAYSVYYIRNAKVSGDDTEHETIQKAGFGLMRIDDIFDVFDSGDYGSGTYGRHFKIKRFKIDPNKIMHIFFNGMAYANSTTNKEYAYPLAKGDPKTVDSMYDTGIDEIPSPGTYDVTTIPSSNPNFPDSTIISPAARHSSVQNTFVVNPLFLVPIFPCGGRTTSEAMDVSRYRYRIKNSPPPNGEVSAD